MTKEEKEAEESEERRPNIIEEEIPVNTEEITMDEIRIVIKKGKKKKSERTR